MLIAQTRRMLADPKSKAFSENFAAQWLDLAGIRRLAVNPEYFKFDERTKDLFEQETIQFVHHVLTENLPINLQGGNLTQRGFTRLYQGGKLRLGHNDIIEWDLINSSETSEAPHNSIIKITHFGQLQTQSRDINPPEGVLQVV